MSFDDSQWLGKLTDQQRSLVEERLKYTDKVRL